VKKTTYLSCAFALTLVAWPQSLTGAAPRCYPTKRFKVLDDLLVRDTLTKLVWQRQASAVVMTRTEAKTYCSSTGDGFRLPTVKELRSIVDLTVGWPGPTIQQEAFPNTPGENFLTSTPSAGPECEWVVSFGNGGSACVGGSDHFRVRCVR
jgi:hypothetical protein